MQIESSFSLMDTAISAMHRQSEYMRNITSGVANARATVPETVGTEGDMGAQAGAKSRGSRINLDHLTVQMTNLNIAAQAYEANIDVLRSYQQITETKTDLLG